MKVNLILSLSLSEQTNYDNTVLVFKEMQCSKAIYLHAVALLHSVGVCVSVEEMLRAADAES